MGAVSQRHGVLGTPLCGRGAQLSWRARLAPAHSRWAGREQGLGGPSGPLPAPSSCKMRGRRGEEAHALSEQGP